MSSKARRVREREEMRRLILDAARELLVEEGEDTFSMRRVADRIEYTPTAIYSYFDGKEALLRALCEEDFQALRSKFAGAAKINDPIERLRRIGAAYAAFALENPSQYRWMFMTEHEIDKSELGIERGNPEQDAYAFLRSSVAGALAEGRFRPEYRDSDRIAQILWGSLHGVLALRMTHGRDDWFRWSPIKKLVRDTIDVVLRGLMREGT